MSITKAVNSKANTKSYSSADLPTNLAQPVIARYSATSTVSQAAITLTFLVDQSNTDAFMLYVDGKLLTIGTGNDYVFAAIDQNNTSSQITLNQILPAGLNIQAYKLGLKKESEFSMDNRFVNVYESLGKSFQPFVDQSSVLTAVNGTPSATQFRSSITNRASIPDISANLKAYIGIERIMTQQIVQLQNEFGPNGETVFSVVNDDKGLIRLVGAWINVVDVSGVGISMQLSGDYIELTFYGTGASILLQTYSAAVDIRVSVDGGSEGSNLWVGTSYSNLSGSRNYPSNQIINLASGLTLGIHTVKVRANAAAGFRFYGFEVLNESSTIKVTPGVSYSSGGKVTSSLSTLAYNSTFESGTLGTRGGRVLVYQKSDGTIAKALTATNTASALATLADHTNEEVVRTYNFREFGAGRSDDFSLLGAAPISAAFTLDDGTTTLSSNSSGASGTGTNICAVNGTFGVLTFVGTGLDVEVTNDNAGGADTYNFQIDGGTTQTWPQTTGSTTKKTIKIASGLPYGTHTFRFNRVTAVTYNVLFSKFIVYQPKKPTLPTGAIELADYNIMADTVSVSTAGLDTISTGVLRKITTRELTYVNGTGGTTDWVVGSLAGITTQIGGFQPVTDRLNAYFEYTFFGTGFDLRYQSATNRSANMPLTIDGLAATTTNFASLSSTVLTGSTYSNSTGLLQMTASTTTGSGVSIRGLTLGTHKVRLTNPTASTYIAIEAIDIVTPIHSAKSNVNFDVQNTLPVGSQGISDNRAFTPIKDVALQTKAYAQAVGITASPSTTSTAYVPCPDLSVTIKTNGGAIDFYAELQFITAAINQYAALQIYVDGVAVPTATGVRAYAAGASAMVTNAGFVPVAAGFHKVDVYWATGASSTITADSIGRLLKVKEI